MRTAKVKVFTIDELKGNVQEHAIAKEREIYWEWGLTETLDEFVIEFLEEKGFHAADTDWDATGRQCGRPYVNFGFHARHGEESDYILELAQVPKELFEKCRGDISVSVHCSDLHPLNRSQVELEECVAMEDTEDDNEYKTIRDIVEEIKKHVQEYVDDVCREAGELLGEKFEHLMSDEYMIGLIEANEMEFLSDGTVWDKSLEEVGNETAETA